MHGVLRLIQNEVSKIFHQMSWRILTIILLLLSVAMPVFNYLVTRGYDNENYYARMEERAKYCEEGSIEKELYLNLASAYNAFTDLGLKPGNWKFERLFSEYVELSQTVRGCQLFVEGRDIRDITDYFSIEGVRLYWDEYDGKESWRAVYYGDENELRSSEAVAEETIDMGSVDEGVPFTTEIAELLIKEKEKRMKEIKEVELKRPLSEFVQAMMKNFEPNYKEAKAAFETARASYEKDKNMIYEYMSAKLVKEGYDIFFGAINATDFDKIEDDVQSRYIDLLDYVNSTISGSPEFAQISEKSFDENGGSAYVMGGKFTDYNDYLYAMEQRQKQYYDAVKMYSYSLRNNIPLESYSSTVRGTIEDFISANLTIITLIGIFMAAVIVASEHTSGAIRLLTIRPRARWKILLSKLSCLGIFLVIWIIATSLLTTITSVILYGSEGMAVPYLMISGGEVFEMSPFLHCLLKMAVTYLPGFSMICLAFLFSVFIKRSGVSMMIPMIINIFGAAASTLFIGSPCKKFPPLKLTPIPYFNLSNFWCDPIQQIYSYNSPLDHGLTLGMGIAMFVIYSAILLALSFVIFKRQQIKN